MNKRNLLVRVAVGSVSETTSDMPTVNAMYAKSLYVGAASRLKSIPPVSGSSK